jgi:hypothetical protein
MDWTTPNLNVTAGPIDAKVAPRDRVNQLGMALGEFSKGLQALEPVASAYAKEQGRKGQAAALAGEEKPDGGFFGNFSAAVRAYDETKGSITGSQDYRLLLQKMSLDIESSDELDDPTTVQQSISGMMKDFLKGKSAEYIRGFQAEAIPLTTKFYEEYAVLQKNKVTKTVLKDIGTLTMNAMDNHLTLYGNDGPPLPPDVVSPLNNTLNTTVTKALKLAESMHVSRDEAITAVAEGVVAAANQTLRTDSIDALLANPEITDPKLRVKLMDEKEALINRQEADSRAREADEKSNIDKLVKAKRADVAHNISSIEIMAMDGNAAGAEKLLQKTIDGLKGTPMWKEEMYDVIADLETLRTTIHSGSIRPAVTRTETTALTSIMNAFMASPSGTGTMNVVRAQWKAGKLSQDDYASWMLRIKQQQELEAAAVNKTDPKAAAQAKAQLAANKKRDALTDTLRKATIKGIEKKFGANLTAPIDGYTNYTRDAQNAINVLTLNLLGTQYTYEDYKKHVIDPVVKMFGDLEVLSNKGKVDVTNATGAVDSALSKADKAQERSIATGTTGDRPAYSAKEASKKVGDIVAKYGSIKALREDKTPEMVNYLTEYGRSKVREYLKLKMPDAAIIDTLKQLGFTAKEAAYYLEKEKP